MAVKIARGKTLPIGVDLGSSVTKMVQLRTTKDDVELLGAQSVQIPPEVRGDVPRRLELLAGELRKALRSPGFKGRQCILSLPAEATFVHHVRIPKVPLAQVPAAVQAKLQGELPYPLSQAIVRHVVAGETYHDGQTLQEVLTVSANRGTLQAYLAMTQRAKLDVVGVNIEACAIVECFARLFRRQSDKARTILYVDLGAASTQVVLSHGPQIVFARNLAVGAERFDQAIADEMGLPLPEAHEMRCDHQDCVTEGQRDELLRLQDGAIRGLSEELTQCLRYYESVFRNQAIERAIFVGGQAYDKQLCQAIAQRLNLPAQIGDPLMRIKCVNGAGAGDGLDRREPQPDWAVAVGLSLGATQAA